MTNKFLDLLMHGAGQLTTEGRVALTASCKDCAHIPKVKNAGAVMKDNTQLMHNGVKIISGGYYGDWMTSIIEQLKGHHEPQEEKVFHEILKRLKPGASMIELGSFWCYYSLWFNSAVPNALNLCLEPDIENMEIGKINAKLNEVQNISFEAAAAGSVDGETLRLKLDSNPDSFSKVTARTVDGLLKEHRWEKLDVLHADTQGAELNVLQGAINTIKSGNLRFLVLSTHHYSISGDPNIHQKCIDFILENGGTIISSHTVAESFSGDGLIAASFDEKDRDFRVETSLSHTDKSLFRPHEKDLEILLDIVNERCD